ncbi:hypothetical protein [Bacillus cereus]|uniref:hypothetical protein n=1 Tax=Bacillus cereus TaxID=1396 RepID=UPI0018CF528C|nr:hypothetical protein [Bacillus cereus]MBG9613502.1 hypothetical protein [Bacillus cereus]
MIHQQRQEHVRGLDKLKSHEPTPLLRKINQKKSRLEFIIKNFGSLVVKWLSLQQLQEQYNRSFVEVK